MSFFANTALSEPVSLPIGSIRKTVMVGYNVGDLATGVANTTIVTENGLWLMANAVYSQAAYPELYSQLGLINAGVFTRKSTVGVVSSGTTPSLGYGNSIYVASSGSTYATSTNLNTWTTRGSGTVSTIMDLAYGNGTYVLCTFSGGISTTTNPNSLEWTPRTSGTTSTFRAITYGAGLFVASADGGLITTSPDGITWTARTSGTTSIINNVLYNNGLFIYGGAGGVLRTSTDGITWTARTSGTTSSIFALAYGNGIYLYGTTGGGLSTSTDGITWTARTSGTTTQIMSIAYGNGIYAYGAGVTSATGAYRTSTDGITWVVTNPGFYGPGGGLTTNYPPRVMYGSGYFYVLYYLVHEQAFASANADFNYNFSNWTTGPVYETQTKVLLGTAISKLGSYQNGYFFFFDSTGAVSFANTSSQYFPGNSNSGLGEYTFNVPTDGFTSTQAGGKPIPYVNGQFIMPNGYGGIYTSTTGTNWTVVDTKTGDYAASGERLNYLNGLYVLTQYFTRNVRTSTDLITWKGRGGTPSNASQIELFYGNGYYWLVQFDLLQSTYFTQNLNDVFNNRAATFSPQLSRIGTANSMLSGTFGNNTFVMAGANGKIYSQTSNLVWVSRSSGTTSTINAVTYGNGLFTYAGNGGVLRTSTNGTTWDAKTSGTTSTIRALTYGNGIYVYAGDGGVLASSTDGTTWTARTSGNTSIIRALTYGRGVYIYGADGGLLRTSTDGTTWNLVTSGTALTIRSLTYGNGIYLYGANNGVLASSTDGTTWTPRTSGTTSTIVALTYGNGAYLYYSDRLWESSDGITWYPHFANNNNNIQASAYGNNIYCLLTNSGSLTTTDFNSWNNYSVFFDTTVRDCVYGNGYFVATTDSGSGSGSIYVSQDAITWTQIQTTPVFGYTSIDYRNGVFTLVGGYQLPLTYASYVATCNTHIKNPLLSNSWTTLITGTNPQNGVIIYANNEYVITSGGGYTATAANTQKINYASGYDASINFYIPGFTGTGNFGTVTTSYSQPAQRVFIKAKNV